MRSTGGWQDCVFQINHDYRKFTLSVNQHGMDKSALEWATKKRSINDFQRFLEDNRNMVPDSVSQKMERLHDDTDKAMPVDIGDKESRDEDGQRIEEYNALMNEVRIT